MTEHTYYICNGCGDKFETEKELTVVYKQRHPNNRRAVVKRHYCEDCEVPDRPDIRTEY